MLSNNFLYIFHSFLGVIGITLAGWAGCFIVDYTMIRKKIGYSEELLTNKNGINSYNNIGISSYIIGVISGFLFTNCAFFNGPFAKGIFENNSLGMIITFIVSVILYFVFTKMSIKRLGDNKWKI